MTENELLEQLQHEVYKAALKNQIESDPTLTRQQKEYKKYCVDVAAQRADAFVEIVKLMRTLGMR